MTAGLFAEEAVTVVVSTLVTLSYEVSTVVSDVQGVEEEL
jgi:hypothetical protein